MEISHIAIGLALVAIAISGICMYYIFAHKVEAKSIYTDTDTKKQSSSSINNNDDYSLLECDNNQNDEEDENNISDYVNIAIDSISELLSSKFIKSDYIINYDNIINFDNVINFDNKITKTFSITDNDINNGSFDTTSNFYIKQTPEFKLAIDNFKQAIRNYRDKNIKIDKSIIDNIFIERLTNILKQPIDMKINGSPTNNIKWSIDNDGNGTIYIAANSTVDQTINFNFTKPFKDIAKNVNYTDVLVTLTGDKNGTKKYSKKVDINNILNGSQNVLDYVIDIIDKIQNGNKEDIHKIIGSI